MILHLLSVRALFYCQGVSSPFGLVGYFGGASVVSGAYCNIHRFTPEV